MVIVWCTLIKGAETQCQNKEAKTARRSNEWKLLQRRDGQQSLGTHAVDAAPKKEHMTQRAHSNQRHAHEPSTLYLASLS